MLTNNPGVHRIDEFNPDYDVQAALDAKKKKRGIGDLLPTIRTDAPGGAYLLDQMGQAKQAIGQGNIARGIGIGARGIATSPLVAGYEALQRVGEEMAPAARGIGNFFGGLVGTDAPAAPITNAATVAPAAPSNYGMNNRGEDYVQPRPVAQSIDAATMQQPTTAAPASNQPNPMVRMDAGWQATADLAAARKAGTGRVKGIGGGLTNPDEYGDAPGYRGPQAPGRGIAGDFDFATNAAADFAARTGNARQARGIGEYISARDAAARGDVQSKAYADNSLTTAQAGESQQRGILTGVQAADMQATQPGRVAGITAGIDQTKAQTAESAQRTAGAQAMLPGQVTAQWQTTELQGIQLKQAKELDALRTKALAGDPKAVEQFRQYMRDQAGKGGNITDEDIVKHWSELVVAHNKAYAGQQDAPPVMSLAEFRSQIAGKQLPMEQNPRALAIQAAVKSGTLKREDGMRQLAALGYSQ